MIGDLTPDISTSPWFTKSKSQINMNIFNICFKSVLNQNIQHITFTKNYLQSQKYIFQNMTNIIHHYITIQNLWYMYTEMTNYHHLSRYIKFICLPVLNRRGWSITVFVGRVVLGWSRFVSLRFSFACLYFRGCKQFYNFLLAMC